METLKQLIAINKAIQSKSQILHPYLVAPSGWGKSSIVSQLAEEMGMPLHIFLLGTMLEYDVIGIPYANGETVSWKIPVALKEACEKPCVLFFDEIDKAREEVIASVLTLMSSRKIASTSLELHPDTIIVVAGQELMGYSSHTYEAFRQRTVPLLIESNTIHSYFKRTYNIDLHLNFEFSFNTEMKISPRLIDYIIRAIGHALLNNLDKENVWQIYKHTLPKELFDSLWDDIMNSQSPEYNIKRIFKLLNAEPQKVDELNTTDLLAIAPFIFDGEFCETSEVTAKVIERIWTEMGEDEASKTLSAIYEHMSAITEGKNEIYIPDEIDVLYKNLREACERIANSWIEKNKKKAKKNEEAK